MSEPDEVTVRDLFAAAALTGLLASDTHTQIARALNNEDRDPDDRVLRLLSLSAHAYADAMLKERTK